jgi:hypothetical protein
MDDQGIYPSDEGQLSLEDIVAGLRRAANGEEGFTYDSFSLLCLLYTEEGDGTFTGDTLGLGITEEEFNAWKAAFEQDGESRRARIQVAQIAHMRDHVKTLRQSEDDSKSADAKFSDKKWAFFSLAEYANRPDDYRDPEPHEAWVVGEGEYWSGSLQEFLNAINVKSGEWQVWERLYPLVD